MFCVSCTQVLTADFPDGQARCRQYLKLLGGRQRFRLTGGSADSETERVRRLSGGGRQNSDVRGAQGFSAFFNAGDDREK